MFSRAFERMRSEDPAPEHAERVDRVKRIEGYNVPTYGHGSGSIIDHRAVKAAAELAAASDLKRRAGGPQRRPDAHEAHVERETETEAYAASGGGYVLFCSHCRKEGHSIRECPGCWACPKCNWMHVNGKVCDNGLARQTWLSIRDGKSKDGRGGRGHGGRGAGRG